MTRGRYPTLNFPIRRIEVCSSVDFERVVYDNTPIRCLRCGKETRINSATAFIRKKSLDDMPYVRCPHCLFTCALENYWPQTERYRKLREIKL